MAITPIRVLCIHGKQQTADVFRDKIAKIIQVSASFAEFKFAEAPFELPQQPGDDLPMRSWSNDGDYSHAAALIQAILAAEKIDVLFGFSQGCLVIAKLISTCCTEMSTVKGVFFAGAPCPEFPLGTEKVRIPTLHLIGSKDQIVLPADSLMFSQQWFERATVIEHTHAHSIPQSAEVCGEVEKFLLQFQDQSELKNVADAVSEELDTLMILFEDGVMDRSPTERTAIGGSCVAVFSLKSPLSEMAGETRRNPCWTLKILIPAMYPFDTPDLLLDQLPEPLSSRRRWQANTIAETVRELGSFVGSPMLAHAIMLLRDRVVDAWDNIHSVVSDSDEQDSWLLEAENRSRWILEAQQRCVELFKSMPAEDIAPQSNGGTCHLTIGLIGKPSAGKSTFFNAITDPVSEAKAAKVAAFPFTTIDPNIGTGFFPVPCPCKPLGLSEAECGAEFGHVTINDVLCRRLPLIIKDVAGLVQGAYAGKGKGNQFLNDLCDANVLVHVVDGAAATDAEGAECLPGEGSALHDVTWVRQELHSWIYDNIAAKWESIRKRPERLYGMFSGYQASQALVEQVLAFVGIRNKKEIHLVVPSWSPLDVHLLVACFVAIRFPVVVALNKCDISSADALIPQIKHRFPDEVFVPMTAKLECELLNLRKQNIIEYVAGSQVATLLHPSNDTTNEVLLRFQQRTKLSSCTTGVLAVLFEAAQRANPVLCFLSTDVRELSKGGLAKCIAFKRNSTVDDVFKSYARRYFPDYQERGPNELKLVRFEFVTLSSPTRVQVLHRDDTISRTVIAHILTNKRH